MTVLKLSEHCSRCPREELRVVTLEEAVELAKAKANGIKSAVKALEIIVDGQLVASYDKLCDECREIVTSYSLNASRKIEKKSSRRVVRPKEERAKEKAPAPSPPKR